MSESNLQHDELEEAPLLQSLRKKKVLFEASEDYFAQLEAKLNETIADEQLLEASPTLHEISKTPYFQVPGKYWETFYQRLNKRMDIKKGYRFPQRPIYLSIAAAVALLLAGLWLLIPSSDPSASWDLSALSTEELVAWVEQENINAYDLAEVLGEDVLKGESLQDWAPKEEEWSEVMEELEFTEEELIEIVE